MNWKKISLEIVNTSMLAEKNTTNILNSKQIKAEVREYDSCFSFYAEFL